MLSDIKAVQKQAEKGFTNKRSSKNGNKIRHTGPEVLNFMEKVGSLRTYVIHYPALAAACPIFHTIRNKREQHDIALSILSLTLTLTLGVVQGVVGMLFENS